MKSDFLHWTAAMGEPTDIHRAHISPAAAKRVLVAIDTEDPGDTGSREGGAYPRIAGYTIERELGRGAGGVTYLAHKAGSEAKIALKVLHAHPGDGTASQRAWRELDTLQQVRVPSVPRLLDYGTTDHSLYIATEFIDGTPLSELYAHARPADLAEMRERVRLLEKIARAAHSLHERGVIHRDLKPSNVIVAPAATNGAGDKPGGAGDKLGGAAGRAGEGTSSVGEPFIIDLGIALIDAPDLHQTLTQDGQPVGTPAFMAPEQARGKREEISTRSDIYSLGAIGYWLCTGETPHDLAGVTLHEAIRRVGSEPPREPRRIAKQVPRPIGSVLHEACAARAGGRYNSAIELAADLGRWRKGQPVRAGQPPAWTRALRWVEQHPRLATTCACATVAMGIIGATTTTLAYLNTAPAGIVLSADGRIATLRALSGQSLREWDAGDGCTIPLAQLLTAAQAARPGGLVIIQLPVESGNHAAGYRVETFGPSDLNEPMWVAPTKLRAPAAGSTDATGDYIPQKALVADVFPESPGFEVLQCYQHPTAYQSAIRVYSLSGAQLYERWHWGPIGELVWIADQSTLVVLAEDRERSWRELGAASEITGYPVVIFALRPALSSPSVWLSGPAAVTGTDLLWYRCVTPPEKVLTFSPSLEPATTAIHPDAFVDLVWTHRTSGVAYHSTLNADGWSLKSWDWRGFDIRGPADSGPAASLGFLPRFPEDYQRRVPPRDPDLEVLRDQNEPLSPPAPIAHWTFDDPFAVGRDSTGHGHDLTVPSAVESVPGPLGGAVRFLSTPSPSPTNYSTQPRGPSCRTEGLSYPGTAGFSVAAWFYIGDSSGTPTIQDYEPHTACTETFFLKYNPTITAIQFAVSHEVSSPGALTVPLSVLPEPRWVHVVGVYETEPHPVIRLYVNGAEMDACRLLGPMRQFERPSRLYVAGSWHSTTPAVMDDVRIYDAPLMPVAVRALYELSHQR